MSDIDDVNQSAGDLPPLPSHYRVVGRIASDRFGHTYLCAHADDAGITRAVVVKLVHHHATINPAFTRVLRDELERLGKISHPNIVEVREVGEYNDRLFIVMPYIEGSTLAELAAQFPGPLPVWLVVQVVTDILNGVQAAHAAVDTGGAAMPLFHDGIAPDSIWLGTYGNTRLADFGFARAAAHVDDEATGSFEGGVYRAPEQLLGGTVDHRADLFAIGVILWGGLIGRPLFTHTNQLIDPEITLPGQLRPDLGRWFDPVCARALRRDPADRYQSAAEMVRALHSAAAMAEAAGSSQKVGELVAEIFAKRIAERRESIGNVAQRDRSSPDPARPTARSYGQGNPIRSRSKPPIPTGAYLKDQLFADHDPPSWPYLESPVTGLPRQLAALQPSAQSRRRFYQIVGLVMLLLMATGVAIVSVARMTRDHRSAPAENAPPEDAPEDAAPASGSR